MKLRENRFNNPGRRKLPNDDNGQVMLFYVVEDGAFGLSSNIVRPYTKRNLSYDKHIYN